MKIVKSQIAYLSGLFFLMLSLLVISPKAWAITNYLEQLDIAAKQGNTQKVIGLADALIVNYTNDPVFFFQAGKQASEFLFSMCATNSQARNYYLGFASHLLSTTGPTNSKQALICFPIKQQIAERLVEASFAKDDILVARSLSRFLGEVRLAMAKAQNQRPFFRNVLPPDGSADAGADSKSIKDAKSRKDYEQLIAENKDAADSSRLQSSVLPQINLAVTHAYLRYCKAMFINLPQTKELVAELSSFAGLNANERKELEGR